MKLLFAEDDARLSKHITYLLRQAGYKVTTAADGEQALQYARDENFDLIVLDWLMPKKSGAEVCTTLRKENVTAGIILVTALDATENIIQGLDCGADDYLVKPFKHDELLARLRALGRRKHKAITDTLRCGELTLHIQARTVQTATETVALTKNEFLLLHYFMQNIGHVLTREQIIAYVWDYDQNVSNNALDALIKLVRKKIDDQHNTHIKTIRGVGYKMQVM